MQQTQGMDHASREVGEPICCRLSAGTKESVLVDSQTDTPSASKPFTAVVLFNLRRHAAQHGVQPEESLICEFTLENVSMDALVSTGIMSLECW